MFTIYSFCKEIDKIGDSNLLKKEKKKEKLSKWKKEINLIFNNKPRNNFGRILKFNIDKYKLKKKFFLDIVKGVEMDINNIMICPKKRIFNLYCYRVAGAVGLLSLNIFGEYNKKSKAFGLHLAKALQITNILRDIKEDALMGRMYIPKETLSSVKIKNSNINSIIKKKEFPEACKKLAVLADLNFEHAENKLKLCSKKS